MPRLEVHSPRVLVNTHPTQDGLAPYSRSNCGPASESQTMKKTHICVSDKNADLAAVKKTARDHKEVEWDVPKTSFPGDRAPLAQVDTRRHRPKLPANSASKLEDRRIKRRRRK